MKTPRPDQTGRGREAAAHGRREGTAQAVGEGEGSRRSAGSESVSRASDRGLCRL